MDRFKRKLTFGFLAGLCMLGAVFGFGALGGGSASPTSSVGIVENVNENEVGENGDLVSISSTSTTYTYEDQVWGGITPDAGYSKIVFDGCYLNGLIDVGDCDEGATIVFRDCYFESNSLISGSEGIDFEFYNCIFYSVGQSEGYFGPFDEYAPRNVKMSDVAIFGAADGLTLEASGVIQLDNVWTNAGLANQNIHDCNGYLEIDFDSNIEGYAQSIAFFTQPEYEGVEYWSGPWNFEDKWAYVVETNTSDAWLMEAYPICFCEIQWAGTGNEGDSNYYRVILYDDTVTSGGTVYESIRYYVSKNAAFSLDAAAANSAGFSKTGYTLAGWAYNSNTAYDESTKGNAWFESITITKSGDLYGVWKPNTYTLSFDANTGSVNNTSVSNMPSSVDLVYETDIFPQSVSVPTLEGYTFTGWYTTAKGTLKVYDANGNKTDSRWQTEDDLSQLSSNRTLYAHWTPEPYDVTFNFYVYASNVPDAADTDITMTGPNADHNGSFDLSQGLSHTFQVEYGTYHITVAAYGDYYLSTTSVTANQTETNEVCSINGKSITRNTSINIYLYQIYDITLVADEGLSTASVIPERVTHGFNASTDLVAAYGYKNPTATITSGTGTVSGNSVSATSDITVMATATPITYNIAYNLAGGTAGSSAPTSADFDDTFYVSAPTRSGYTFTGWRLTTTDYYASYTNGTAKWGTSSSVAKTITSESTLCANGATGNVYFKGLSGKDGGSATLTATWTANTYSVTLNAGSATSTSHTKSVTATYGSAMPSITVPTRTGYDFAGYYDSADANGNGKGTQYYTAGGASAKAWDKAAASTLYAKWTPKTYKVYIDLFTSFENVPDAEDLQVTLNGETKSSQVELQTGLVAGYKGTENVDAFIFEVEYGTTFTPSVVLNYDTSATPDGYTIMWYDCNDGVADYFSQTKVNSGEAVEYESYTMDASDVYLALYISEIYTVMVNYYSYGSGSIEIDGTEYVHQAGDEDEYIYFHTAHLYGGEEDLNSIDFSVSAEPGCLIVAALYYNEDADFFYDLAGSELRQISWKFGGDGGYEVVCNALLDIVIDLAGVYIGFEGDPSPDETLCPNFGDNYELTDWIPQKSGYDFVGWQVQDVDTGEWHIVSETDTIGSFNEIDLSIADWTYYLTLYQAWEPSEFTITLNPNGGTFGDGTTANKTVTGDYGSAVNLTNNLTKEGYIFTGWTFESTANGFYDVDSMTPSVSGSITGTATTGFTFYKYRGDYLTTSKIEDATSPTGFSQQFVSTGANVDGNGNPIDAGGFSQYLRSEPGGVYLVTFTAKLPVGYYFVPAGNSLGADVGVNRYTWIGNNTGTGDWARYSYMVDAAEIGYHSSFGYVKVQSSNTSTYPLNNFTWWLADHSIFTLCTAADRATSSTPYLVGPGNDTLTAQWAPAASHVKFYLEGSDPNEALTGTSYSWELSYAKWRNVTGQDFVAEIAMVYDRQRTNTNGAPAASAMSRPGYTFKGWATAEGTLVFDGSSYLISNVAGYTGADQTWKHCTPYDNGTTSLALYAQWEKDAYTITYNANGGTTTAASASFDIDTTTLTLETPTRTGFDFNGWTLAWADDNNSGTLPAVSNKTTVALGGTTWGNMTATASWTANTYNIYYRSNTISTNGNAMVDYCGWWTDFDAEDAATYGESVTLDHNGGCWMGDGYTFKGFSTTLNGQTAQYQENETFTWTLTEDLYLYAIWEANVFEIKIEQEYDGVAHKTIDIVFGQNYKDIELLSDVDLELFEKDGYTLNGFYDSVKMYNDLIIDSEGKLVQNAYGGSGLDIIADYIWIYEESSFTLWISADYTPNTYDVTYNLNYPADGYENYGATINGGLLTSDDGLDYIKVSAEDENGNAYLANDNWEIVVKTRRTETTTAAYSSFFRYGDGYSEGILLAQYSNGNVALWAQPEGSSFHHIGIICSTTTAKATQFVWVKLLFADGVLTTHYSLDGKVYTASSISIDENVTIANSNIFKLGLGWGSDYKFLNEIDLGETYISVGGEVVWGHKPTTSTQTFGAAYAHPTAPTRDGYSFAGWYLDRNFGTAATTVSTAADHTLYAKWTALQYNVTLNSNWPDDAADTTETVNVSAGAQTFVDTAGNAVTKVLEKDGYNFNGWWTAAEGGVQVTKSDGSFVSTTGWNIYSDTTLYAQWTPKSLVLIATLGEGTVTNANGWTYDATNDVYTKSVTFGTAIGALPTIEREGHTFSGWTYNGNSIDTSYVFTTYEGGSKTIAPTWDVNSYTITLDVCTFEDGFKYGDFGMGQITDTSWTKQADGTYTQTFEYGETIDLPTPILAGHYHIGWYGDSEGITFVSDVSYVVREDVTLYAGMQIDIENILILFDLNGGTAEWNHDWTPPEDLDFIYAIYMYSSSKLFYIESDEIDMWLVEFPGFSNVHRDGYTFTGLTLSWVDNYNSDACYYTTDDSIGAGADVSTAHVAEDGLTIVFDGPTWGNIQATAQWAKQSYTVTLDGNGATSTDHTTSVTATYDEAMPAIATLPRRTGYTFGGYYTGTKDATTGEVTFTTQYYGSIGESKANWNIASDTTLYAKWTANTCFVIFDGNGATGGAMAAQEFTYDVEQRLAANAFTRTGYTFAGWNTQANGGGRSYNDNALVWSFGDGTSDVTLYAQWTANRIEVMLDLNNSGLVTTPVYAATDKNAASVDVSNNNIYIEYDSSNIFNAESQGTQIAVMRASSTGYKFKGWYADADSDERQIITANGALVTGNVAGLVTNGVWTSDSEQTLYAHWEIIEYTITYTSSGYQNLTSKYSIAGSGNIANTISQEDAFKKTGYVLSGWTASATTGSTNGAVSNLWTTDGYNEFTYDADGDLNIAHALAGQLDNYRFGDVTLTAVWTKEEYTLSFDLQLQTYGGVGVTSHTVTFDKAVDSIARLEADPYGTMTELYPDEVDTIVWKTGHNFLGYYSGPEGAGVKVFDASGTPTADGVTAGWFRYDEETGVYYWAKDMTDEDSATLYAHYEALKYTINLSGGAGIDTWSVSYVDTDGAAQTVTKQTSLSIAYDTQVTLSVTSKTGYSAPEIVHGEYSTQAQSGLITTYTFKITAEIFGKSAGETDFTLANPWLKAPDFIAAGTAYALTFSAAAQQVDYDIYYFIEKAGGTGDYAGQQVHAFSGKKDIKKADEEITMIELAQMCLTDNILAEKPGLLFDYVEFDGKITYIDTSATYDELLSMVLGEVKGDGSTSIYLYFKYLSYNIVYDYADGTQGEKNPVSTYFDTAFEVSAPTRTAYNFTGWTVSGDADYSTAKYGTTGSISNSIENSATLCVNGANSVYFTGLSTTNGGSVTLTANWQAITYNISYQLDDGELADGVTNASSYTVESANILLNNPSKEGYTFVGWVDSRVIATGKNYYNYLPYTSMKIITGGKVQGSRDDSTWTDVCTTPSDVTFYAVFRANAYQITWHANGGILPANGEETLFDFGLFNEPYLPNDFFVEMGDDRYGTYTYDPTTKIYSINVTNNTDQIQYVTLAAMEVDYRRFVNLRYDFTLEVLTIDSSDGFEFDVLSAGEHTAQVAPEMLGYISPEVGSYGTDGVWGRIPEEYGELSGFRAVAWLDSGESFKATYQTSVSRVFGVYGILFEFVPEYQPLKQGYTFKGWNTEADGTGETINQNSVVNKAEEQTFYAVWEANKYNVELAANGGESLEVTAGTGVNSVSGTTLNVTYDTDFEFSVKPTRNNFTFLGFDADVNATQPTYAAVDNGNGTYSVSIADNLVEHSGSATLYAIWKANKVTVTLDLNVDAGSTAVSYDNTSYADDTNKPTLSVYAADATTTSNYEGLTSPSRMGYKFDGWFTQDGSTSGYWGTQVDGTTKYASIASTLYAKWTANKYDAIYFENVGGTNSQTFEDAITFDQNFTTKGELFARTGYTLSVWNVGAVDSTISVAKTTQYLVDAAQWTAWGFNDSTSVVNLYANWTANVYDVTFHANGGKVAGADSTTISQTYAAAYTLPAAPVRAGYNFIGWFTEQIADNAGTTGKTQITAQNIVEITADSELYAYWTSQSGIKFVVNHYVETLASAIAGTSNSNLASKTDGVYTNVTLHSSNDTLTGTAGEVISVSANMYETITGFTSVVDNDTYIIAGDGSLVIDIFYSRNAYSFEISQGTGITSITATSAARVNETTNPSGEIAWQNGNTNKVYYGEALVVSAGVKAGYYTPTFSVTAGGVTISNNANLVVGTADIKLDVSATAGLVDYELQLFYMSVDGTYPTAASEIPTGTQYTVDATLTYSSITSNYLEEGYVFDATATGATQSKIEAKFDGENVVGTTVIKLYYSRVTSYVTVNNNNGEATYQLNGLYGSSVEITEPVKTGYTFATWNLASSGAQATNVGSISGNVYTFGTEDALLTAVWSTNSYTVLFNANAPEQNYAYNAADEYVMPESTMDGEMFGHFDTGAKILTSDFEVGDWINVRATITWENLTFAEGHEDDAAFTVVSDLLGNWQNGQIARLVPFNGNTSGTIDYWANGTLTETMLSIGNWWNVILRLDYVTGGNVIVSGLKAYKGTSTLTTNSYGGYNIHSYYDTASYNGTFDFEYAVPVRQGYTFGGYYDSPDCTGTQIVAANGALLTGNQYVDTNGDWIYAGDVTFYAKWTEISYNIEFTEVYNNFEVVVYDKNGENAHVYTITSENSTVRLKFTDIIQIGSKRPIAKTVDGAAFEGLTGLDNPTRFGYEWGCSWSVGGTWNPGVTVHTTGWSKFARAHSGLEGEDWGIAFNTTTPSYQTTGNNFTRLLENDGTAKIEILWAPRVSDIALNENAGDGSTEVTLPNGGVAYVLFGGTGFWSAKITNASNENLEYIDGNPFNSSNPLVASRVGYTFNGWWTSADNSGVQVINENGVLVNTDEAAETKYVVNGKWNFVGDVALFAHWTASTSTITLNPNGGADGTASVNVDFDATTLDTITNPTRKGYTFEGWTLTNGGTDFLIDKDGALVNDVKSYTDADGAWIYVGNVTVYAKWTANTYYITLNANGGALAEGQADVDANAEMEGVQVAIIYDQTATLQSVLAPARDGYQFQAWSIQADASSSANDIISTSGALVNLAGHVVSGKWNVDRNITIYARWNANDNTKYIVNYYQQNIGMVKDAEGNYITTASNISAELLKANSSLFESVEYYGTTGAAATGWAINTYTGFTHMGAANESNNTIAGEYIISGDGSLEINIYYFRHINVVTMAVDTDGSIASASIDLSKYVESADATDDDKIAAAAEAGVYNNFAQFGATVYVTATRNTGYKFDIWTVDMGSATFADATSAETSFAMQDAATTINANGSSKLITITFGSVADYAAEPSDTIVADNQALDRDASTEGIQVGVGDVLTLSWKFNLDNIMFLAWDIYFNDSRIERYAMYSQTSAKSYKISSEYTENYSALDFRINAKYYWHHQAATNFTELDITGGAVASEWQWTLALETKGFWSATGYGSDQGFGNGKLTPEIYAQAKEGYHFYGWYLRQMPTVENYKTTAVALAEDCTYVSSNAQYPDAGSYYSYQHDMTSVNPADGQTGGGTFYALFLPNEYAINYAGMEGAEYGENAPTSAKYNEAFALSAPTKAGYTFAGWKVTSDNLANAKYSLTSKGFDTEGESFAIDADTLVLNGAEGEVWLKYLTTSTSAVTLTATWTTNTYTITYNANDGTLSSATSMTYTTDTTDKLYGNADISRKGYTLVGWNVSSATDTSACNWVLDTTSVNYAPEMALAGMWGDVTLNAIWEANRTTIKLDANGGEFAQGATTTFETRYGDSYYGSYLPNLVNATTNQGNMVTDENGWYNFTNLTGSGAPLAGIDYTMTRFRNGSILPGKDYTIVVEVKDLDYDGVDGDVMFVVRSGSTSGTWGDEPFNAASAFNITSNGVYKKTLKGRDITDYAYNKYYLRSHFSLANETMVVSKVSVRISVVEGDGSNIDTDNYVSTYDLWAAAEPTREGYEFAGWWTNTGLEATRVLPTTKMLQNKNEVTVYAKWRAKAVEVTYDANGGNLPEGTADTESLTYGSSYGKTNKYFVGNFINPSNFTLSDEVFNVNIDNTSGTETKYLGAYKRFDPELFTPGMTYTAVVEVLSFNSSTDYILFDLGKSTYYSSGWITPLSEHTYIYIYDAGVHSVSFTTKDVLATEFLTQGIYEFSTNIGVVAGESLEMTFRISIFEGENVDTENFEYVAYNAAGDHLPTPTREGYTFNGWYSDESLTKQVTSETIVSTTSAHTLFAGWTANEYEITFDKNTGSFDDSQDESIEISGGSATKTVTYDEMYGTLASVSKTGYEFLGWNTQADGKGETISSDTLVGEKDELDHDARTATLYAIWQALELDVTFVGNGGTFDAVAEDSTITIAADGNSASKTVTFDAYYGEIPTINKVGYGFNGWNTRADGSGINISDKTVVGANSEVDFANGSITLYAQWSNNEYTLTLNANGGSIEENAAWTLLSDGTSATKKVEYNVAYGTLPTNNTTQEADDANATITRDGYLFDGWWTNNGGSSTSDADWGSEITADSVVAVTGAHTIYARWIARTDTQYVVNYYLENLGVDLGSMTDSDFEAMSAAELAELFTLESGVTCEGTTDTETAGVILAEGATLTSAQHQLKEFDGFTTPGAKTRVIKGDNSLVINYFYTRNQYIFNLNGRYVTYDESGEVVSSSINDDIIPATIKIVISDANGNELASHITGGNYNDYNAYVDFGATITLSDLYIPNGSYGYVGYNTNNTDEEPIEKLNAFETIVLTKANAAEMINLFFVAETNIVSYELDGGSMLESAPSSFDTARSEQTLTVVSPTKAGFDFAGWTIAWSSADNSDNAEIGATPIGISIDGTTMTIAENIYGYITLIANWTEHSYSIVFGSFAPEFNNFTVLVADKDGNTTGEGYGFNTVTMTNNIITVKYTDIVVMASWTNVTKTPSGATIETPLANKVNPTADGYV